MTETIIIALIGSGALSALISGIFQLINNRQGKKHADRQMLEDIKKELEEQKEKQLRSEKDAVRLQLLVLMASYPEKTEEILTTAHHYFVELGANWILTPLFYAWLEDNNVARPEWFTMANNNER